MEWDLGWQGIAVLGGLSLGFALITQLVFWNRSRWAWLIGLVAFLAAGLFVSEVWFGWATQEELQPNIDGLSFDEVLLIGYGVGVPLVVVARYLLRRGSHQPMAH